MINIFLGARLDAQPQAALEFPVPSHAPTSVELPEEPAPHCGASPLAEPVDGRDIGRRLRAGEALALAQLYDAHGPGLFRLLVAMLGSRADAEDALQETFVKLAARGSREALLPFLGALGRVRDWRAYLLASARNEALSVLRRRGRESQMDTDEAWEQLPDERAQAASGSLEAHDWPRLLRRLPLEQREVVVLKVWEQMTFAQIALVVGVSPNTAMSRYRYAIARLRAWCQQAGCEEADHE